MRVSIRACDLGLTRGRFGACKLDTHADGTAPSLVVRQRAARAIAGLGFLGVAIPMLKGRWRPGGVAAAWFGATHVLATATAFGGCPELGAVSSLVLRRQVAAECGPWDWLDARLRLTSAPN